MTNEELIELKKFLVEKFPDYCFGNPTYPVKKYLIETLLNEYFEMEKIRKEEETKQSLLNKFNLTEDEFEYLKKQLKNN